MKTVYKGLLILLFPVIAFAQQSPMETRQDREDLLQKSKSQKTTGFLLLGIGAAAAIGGVVLFDDNFTVFGDGNDNAAAGGAFMAIAGGVSMLGSIPFFIASSNNKQKAMQMSAGIRMERLPLGISRHFASYPAMAVNIRIR